MLSRGLDICARGGEHVALKGDWVRNIRGISSVGHRQFICALLVAGREVIACNYTRGVIDPGFWYQ